jgi:hypothetical protein
MMSASVRHIQIRRKYRLALLRLTAALTVAVGHEGFKVSKVCIGNSEVLFIQADSTYPATVSHGDPSGGISMLMFGGLDGECIPFMLDAVMLSTTTLRFTNSNFFSVVMYIAALYEFADEV